MRARLLLLALVSGLALPRPAVAIEAKVTEIRVAGGTVRAAIEVRDLFPERFRTILEQGGAIHLRLQLELWESRSVWDRLAHPALVSIFRILLDPATHEISVADEYGEVSRQPAWQEPLTVRLDLGRADDVKASARYYVRLATTLGTVADRDPAGAVLDSDDSPVSLGSVGRAIFHAVLQVSDYLQSVSSEWRSPVLTGRELLAGVKPGG